MENGCSGLDGEGGQWLWYSQLPETCVGDDDACAFVFFVDGEDDVLSARKDVEVGIEQVCSGGDEGCIGMLYGLEVGVDVSSDSGVLGFDGAVGEDSEVSVCRDESFE